MTHRYAIMQRAIVSTFMQHDCSAIKENVHRRVKASLQNCAHTATAAATNPTKAEAVIRMDVSVFVTALQ